MSARAFVSYGAFGGVNVGDEAILCSVVEMIRDISRGQQVRWVIARHIPHAEAASLYQRLGLEFVQKTDLGRVVRLLAKAPLVIGGGQLLDGAKLPKGLLYILFLVIVNRLCGSHPAIVGIGVDQIQQPLSKYLAGLILKLCRPVCCRDQHSRGVLEKFAPPGRVKLTADVVFCGPVLGLRSTSAAIPWAERSSVVIAVQKDPNWQFRSSHRLLDMVQFVLSAFPGKRVVVVAHDIRQDYDAAVLREVADRFGDQVETKELTSLPLAIDLYSNASWVVSGRMHPLILGMLAGARPIALGETGKVVSLMESLECPFVVIAENGEYAFPEVEKLVTGWTEERDVTLSQKLREKKELARENFRWLEPE